MKIVNFFLTIFCIVILSNTISAQASLDQQKIGSVVSLSQFNEEEITSSRQPYDPLTVGIIKANISNLHASDLVSISKNKIVKDGICYVLYNSQNGQIHKGDPLTSSSTPGEAMKATKSGMMIGIALEDASALSGLLKIRVIIQFIKF